jgi:hypothetical protein
MPPPPSFSDNVIVGDCLVNHAGHEVDFILEEAGKLVALEIKAGSQVTTGDLIGIRAFEMH